MQQDGDAATPRKWRRPHSAFRMLPACWVWCMTLLSYFVLITQAAAVGLGNGDAAGDASSAQDSQ
jgi:hypothetical protein